MNCDIKSEQFDIKQEVDPLPIAEIKIEPQVVNAEESFDNWLDDNSQSVQTNAVKTENNIKPVLLDASETYGTDLQEEKCDQIAVKVEYAEDGLDNCLDDDTTQTIQKNADNAERKVIPTLYDSCETDLHEEKCDQIADVANLYNICNISFSYEVDPVEDTRILTIDKQFNCDICSKSFSRKYLLAQHNVRNHTNEKPFKCHLCSKSFSRKHHLTQHILTHTNGKPFKCNVCSKCFSLKSNLKQHTRIHTNNRPFKCNICNRSFSYKHYLVNHLNSHSNEKLFTCNVCKKSFSYKQNLVQHTRTHTDETPFKCDICNKSFTRKSGLADHARIHTKEKPFKCGHCGKRFTFKSSFNYHTRIHVK